MIETVTRESSGNGWNQLYCPNFPVATQITKKESTGITLTNSLIRYFVVQWLQRRLPLGDAPMD